MATEMRLMLNDDILLHELKVHITKEVDKIIKNAVIEKPLYPNEAADHLRISRATLDRKLKKGVIPSSVKHVDKDGMVYFLASELNQYIKSL
jgi:predicted DNA-binding transcriptional regulator AlpA